MNVDKKLKILIYSSISLIIIIAFSLIYFLILNPPQKLEQKLDKVEKFTNKLSSRMRADITGAQSYAQWVSTGSVNLPGLGSNPIISVVNQDIVFIAGGSGVIPRIYRSTNSGSNFSIIPVNGIKRIIYSIWAVSIDTIYVGDGGNDGLQDTSRVYLTVNGGSTWTEILSTAPEKGFINGIIFSSSNPGYGIIQSDGNTTTSTTFKVWKTNNYGLNWTLTTPSFPSNPSPGMVGSLFMVDSIFYGFGTLNEPLRIVYTSNGGVNWNFSELPKTLKGSVSGIGFNSDKIHGLVTTFTTSNKIAKTSNGGISWTFQTIPSSVISAVGTVKYIPSSNTAYLVVSTGSKTEGYQTDDDGETWNINTFPAGTKSVTNFNLKYLPNTSSSGQVYVYSASQIGSTYKMFDTPLPIHLLSFTHSISENDVTLKWITVKEENNSGFEIYRASKDGNNWTKLGFVNGNGNKNTPSKYNYIDKKVSSGNYSYRIKQIDYNGNFEYFVLSSIVSIGVPNKFMLSQNYPNPFNPITNIDYQIPQNANVKLKLYDITGREVMSIVNDNQAAGYYTVQANAGNLASGNYMYKLSVTFADGKENYLSKKMTVVK